MDWFLYDNGLRQERVNYLNHVVDGEILDLCFKMVFKKILFFKTRALSFRSKMKSEIKLNSQHFLFELATLKINT